MRPVLLALAIGTLSAAPCAHGSVVQPGPSAPPPKNPEIGPPVQGPPGAPGKPPQGPTTPSPKGPKKPKSPQGLGDLPADDLDGWWWWWKFNRHHYLDLRERLAAAGPRTGIGASDSPRPPVFAERVVPALIAASRSARDVAVRSGCMIALAKIGDGVSPEDRPPLRSQLTGWLEGGDGELAETAALALGILGDEAAAPALAGVLGADERRRRSTESDRVRVFAAYGLGLLGQRTQREDVRRFIALHLEAELERRRTRGPDLPVACVLAMGLVPLAPAPSDSETPAAASREAQVDLLLNLVEDRREDELVRAHAATSAARLVADLDPSASPGLRERVARCLLDRLDRRSGASNVLLQSCALALGLFGDSDADEIDGEIREQLKKAGADHGNAHVRSFALVALAQTAARPGIGMGAGSAVAETRGHLVKRLGRGRKRQRAWCGLALGVLSQGLAAPDPTVADVLAEVARTEKGAGDLAAYCLAAGLASSSDASGSMLRALRDRGDGWLRGYAAMGLGLLAHAPSKEAIADLVRDSRYRPELVSRAALALALCGDEGASALLAQMLDTASGSATKASIANAMGEIGDERAVEPLLELLADSKASPAAIAFAAVALGHAGDKDDVPWSAHYSAGLNYLAAPPTLYDTTHGRGVLNIH